MKTNGIDNHIAVFFCGLIVTIFALVSGASAQTALKPNLQARPAWNISLSGGRLYFNATNWNNGDGPLELVAGETDSVAQKQNVYQRIYLSDGNYYDQLAGSFVWHPLHNHFHFEDFAVYTLQPYDAPGASDRMSQKTTFCVMDTTKINGSLTGAPATAVYSTCGNIKQGMSVGWGDTYGSSLAGQSIDVTGLPNGSYKLVIEVDPKNRLQEINENVTDNTSCVLLQLNISSSTMSVLNPNDCSGTGTGTAVAVGSISPNWIRAGSIITTTIKGSGFTPGMSVSFENGSGQRPVATVTSVSSDGTTINANVTVKKGGNRTDRLWDVRVGTGVLRDGFTVQ
jgi:hypothetical protein